MSMFCAVFLTGKGPGCGLPLSRHPSGKPTVFESVIVAGGLNPNAGAGDGPRSFVHAATVVAGLDDPLAASSLARDNPHMVGPDDNRTNLR